MSRCMMRASKSSVSTRSSNMSKSAFKKACLKYIGECLKQNKRNCEILKDVRERFGSYRSGKKTIQNWISAVKSTDRNASERKLGTRWMHYWDALHSDSRESDQTASSIKDDSESSATEARSTMTNDREFSDIIEIKYEPDLIKPNPVSSTKREPHSILGQATLNGQAYFMVKWNGRYKDELGMS